MAQLADGDLSTNVTGTERHDEIGLMAKTTLVFKENMIHNEELQAEATKAQEARNERAARIETMTSDFEKSVETMLSTVASASTQMKHDRK